MSLQLDLVAASFRLPDGSIIPLELPIPADDAWLWTTAGAVRDAACLPLSAVGAGPLILRATLRASEAVTTNVTVKASRAAGAAMGTLPQVVVTPGQWNSLSCTVEILVNPTSLTGSGVKRCRLVLKWTWARAGSTTRVTLGRSEHQLFITLTAPSDPWAASLPAPMDQAKPWSGALALACDWGAGVTNHAGASSAIVGSFFARGWKPAAPNATTHPFTYAPDSKSYLPDSVCQPQWFDWGPFLRDLRDASRTDPIELSCVATSAIVLTLANLLGCELDIMLIDPPHCDEIALRPLKFLGTSGTQTNEVFVFHVVATSTGTSGLQAQRGVFDPSFKIKVGNGTANTFTLAAGMSFGPGAGTYRTSLVSSMAANASVGVYDRPRVHQPASQTRVNRCEAVRLKRYAQSLSAIPAAEILPRTWEVRGMNAGVTVDLPRAPVRPDTLPRVPPATRTLYYKGNPLASKPVLQVDVWRDAQPVATLTYLAELLASLPKKPVQIDGRTGYLSADGRARYFLIPGGAVRLTALDPDVTLVNIVGATPR